MLKLLKPSLFILQRLNAFVLPAWIYCSILFLACKALNLHFITVIWLSDWHWVVVSVCLFCFVFQACLCRQARCNGIPSLTPGGVNECITKIYSPAWGAAKRGHHTGFWLKLEAHVFFAATCCLLVEILRTQWRRFCVSQVRFFFFLKWIGAICSSWTNLCYINLFLYIFKHTVSCFITMITGQKKSCTARSWGQRCENILGKKSARPIFVNDGSWHTQLIFMFYWMGWWIIERLCVPAGPLFRRRTKQCGGNKNPDTLKTRGTTPRTPLHSHSFVTLHTYRWIQPYLLAYKNNLM